MMILYWILYNLYKISIFEAVQKLLTFNDIIFKQIMIANKPESINNPTSWH